MKRKTWLGLATAFAAATSWALVQPQRINFQGKLIDPATNNPKAGPVTLTFNLYNVQSGGSSLYSETQSNVPLTNGVFSVEIGTLNAISRDLFLGASAYLGVTVQGDTEMSPRQNLTMSAYAFTANQLSDLPDVRLIAGPTYSTFTSAGNLTVPAGVVGSSGTFTNGVTASSGTFLATGGNQFSIATSSGIQMNAGTLDLTNTSGIRADDTGIVLSTIDFTGQAADPNGNAGYMYYNTSTGSIKVFDGSGKWAYLFGQSLDDQKFSTTNNSNATAAKAAAATILVEPFYLSHPMMVDQMRMRVTTVLGAAGDLGIYDVAGNLLLNGGASTLTTTAGAKTVAPVQTGNTRFLPPGQYYAAVTWNSTTGVVGGDVTTAGLMNRVGTVLGGGTTLPSTITPSAITAGTVLFFFEINP
jgi:hypothetical protein